MLHIVETNVVQKNYYVIDVDPPFTKEDATNRLNEMNDFSQQYQGEEVTEVLQITTEEYIKFFDTIYPSAKDLPKTTKLLQINNINDTILKDESTEGDML